LRSRWWGVILGSVIAGLPGLSGDAAGAEQQLGDRLDDARFDGL
jgi:hypothetical protein